MKKTTEELIYELEDRFGNPNGPVEFKIVVEAINLIKELNDELQTLKLKKT